MSDKDYWTSDGLIFYHNGEGWAIHPSGATVCLCRKEDTDRILKGEINVETVKDTKQRETLIKILEIRKWLGYGDKTELFKPRGAVGGRNVRAFQPRKAGVRQSAYKASPSLRSIVKSV